MTEFVDVAIVGAGISGISAAWHLQGQNPDKTYAILERRDRLGGTWDLFKYPGIRSDSDMYTLGFHFKPWATDQSIADGASIWNYLNEAATENGIDKHIRYGHKVVAANWSDEDVIGYLYRHDVPYNALHDEGYPSIGCFPCTRAVAPGDDPRSGRWAGTGKTECGLHLPVGGAAAS